MTYLSVHITPPDRPIEMVVELPASKSISNRLLVMAALSGHTLNLPGLSNARDTWDMREALSCDTEVVNAGEGGTTYRFLLAYYCCRPGTTVLQAAGPMKERPIGTLVDALRQLGAQIEYLDQEGFPPVQIKGGHIAGGSVTLDGSVSSQYASALMLIGPYLKGGLVIRHSGTVVSSQYLRLTESLMQQHGVPVAARQGAFFIPEGKYTLGRVQIEPDWSAASFWYSIVSLAERAEVELTGLWANSIQGDKIISEWMHPMGVETFFSSKGALLLSSAHQINRFALQAAGTPDIVLPALTTAALRGITLDVYGIHHLKYKESNRLASMQRELQQLGASFAPLDEHWQLAPGELPEGEPEIITYNDHRMAMSFAPAALRTGGITILEPLVVRKSYPAFWDHLEQAGFYLEFKKG